MTLDARLARLESRVPAPARAVVVARRFYVSCPHCGAPAALDREADPARHTPWLGADTPGATGTCAACGARVTRTRDAT